MKIATYNVNSVNARLPVLLRWLAESGSDAVCLQELKTSDEKFPIDAVRCAGYVAVWHGQKAYNGVAILATKRPAALPRGRHVRPVPRPGWGRRDPATRRPPVVQRPRHDLPPALIFSQWPAESIARDGTIRLPFGESRTSPIDTRDLAEVIAAVLEYPEAHVGKVIELTGPRSQDMRAVAAEYSKALGRTTTYVDVPMGEWLERELPRTRPARARRQSHEDDGPAPRRKPV